MFSDEATVRLSGFVNPHKVRIWMNKSQRALMDRTTRRVQSLCFCAIYEHTPTALRLSSVPCRVGGIPYARYLVVCKMQ